MGGRGWRPRAAALLAAVAALGGAASLPAAPLSAQEDGPVVSLGDAQVLEPDAGARGAFLPVALSEPAAAPVVVSFRTQDGTAGAGSDYTRWGTTTAPRTVTIPAGSLQATVNVPVLADGAAEADEAFTVVATAATGAALGDPEGTVTVLDPDSSGSPNPVLAVVGVHLPEGDAGTRRAQFQVQLSRPAASAVSVAYRTEDGTATAPGDYTTKLPGTLTLPPGQVLRVLDVRVPADTTVEGDRAFTLVGTVTGGPPVEELSTTGTAVIVDDDPGDTVAPVLSLPGDLTLAATSPSGAAVTWTATATDAVDGPVAVTCTPGPGSFAVGTTTVSCTAADVAGNTASAGFSVTVTPFVPAVAEIDAGGDHTCARLAGGTLRCWGGNASGQLGTGTTTATAAPVAVPGLTGVVDVSAGAGFTCAVLGTGGVRCWGRNTTGQLGNGTTVSSTTPVPVTGITTAVAVSAGSNHTCALRADGTVTCWGQGTSGQLGNGATANASVPQGMGGLNAVAVSVSAGDTHTCARMADGTARCWGRYAIDELENFDWQRGNVPFVANGVTAATGLTSGGGHSCTVHTDTKVRCWGLGFWGRLGSGLQLDQTTAVPVISGPFGSPDLTGAVGVDAGFGHTCAVLSSTGAMCWGRNTNGQVGNGLLESARPGPVAVPGLTGVASMSLGGAHTCALGADGSVRCWGSNASGQVGTGTAGGNQLTPATVTGLG